MSNKAKIILLAVLIPILLVLVLIGTHVICIFHEWVPATCTAPETCKFCDAVQGEALGHKWEEATCETAKTCEICGKVEGQALGHDWAEATCLTATTCNFCGKTEGEPAGHQWQEATCTAPRTCSGCGETEGEALGHIEKEYEPTSDDIVQGAYSEAIKCAVCGETITFRMVMFTTYIKGDRFQLTPDQLMRRCDNAIKEINGSTYDAGTKMLDGKLYGVIWDNNGKASVAFTFIGTGTDEVIGNKNAKNLRGVLGYVYDENAAAYALFSMIRAADPQLSFDQVKDIGANVLQAAKKDDSYSYNGIKYMLQESGKTILLGMAIDN